MSRLSGAWTRPAGEFRRHGHADGTTWPIYDDDMDQALRYGGEGLLTRADKLYLASVLSAFNHLTDPQRTQSETVEALKRARRVRREDEQ